MNAMTLPHMGHKLLVRLGELNLSQSDLAKIMGRTRQEISRLTDTAEWQVKTVHRIAKALKVPVTYFFEY